MVKTISLFPGVTLRCFPADRFKQGCLTVQFLRPMCRREASLNALLPAVLLRGTAKAPDLRRITLRLDDLYGASAGCLIRRGGDYQATGLSLGFIEDQFALEGDQILAPVAEFLRELLLEPLLENGVFCRRYVESEKKHLLDAIASNFNDKQAYATSQLLKNMCREDAYGIPRLGEPEQVEAITPEALYAHYQRILAESPVELFYVGAEDPEQVATLLGPIFGFPRTYAPLPPHGPCRLSQPGHHSQVMDVSQGKLAMGFVTEITSRDPEFAPMQVLNTLFGGGFTSKLFQNVREKQSLCYSISSSYLGSKGILLVSAGIDCAMESTVRQEILTQLEACRTGSISDAELQTAKEALLNSLRGLHDSPGSIESYYGAAAVSGLTLDRDSYMAAVRQVTLEQVVAAANRIRLHSSYFIKGEA